MLSRYVLQEGLLPLPTAIRKLTANPARRLRLPGRGTLAPGQAADVVVVELGRLRPAADPFRSEPFRGVDVVVLNGQVVVENAEYTGRRAGVVLTR
jgi:dihydroorotase-like cyclic amidohydrolase